MNKQLHHASALLRAHDARAYRRRVGWMDFEDRLRRVYAEADPTAWRTLGGLHVATLRHVYGSRRLRFETMNQAQLSTGWRHLGFVHAIGWKEGEDPKPAMERGACLSFSQLVNGAMTVTLFPYRSDLAKVKEDDILLAIGLDPHELTEAKIRSFMVTLARYCVASSAMTIGSYGSGLYRTRLRLSDLRYRIILRAGIFRVVEKVLALGFAGGALIAAVMALK